MESGRGSLVAFLFRSSRRNSSRPERLKREPTPSHFHNSPISLACCRLKLSSCGESFRFRPFSSHSISSRSSGVRSALAFDLRADNCQSGGGDLLSFGELLGFCLWLFHWRLAGQMVNLKERRGRKFPALITLATSINRNFHG